MPAALRDNVGGVRSKSRQPYRLPTYHTLTTLMASSSSTLHEPLLQPTEPNTTDTLTNTQTKITTTNTTLQKTYTSIPLLLPLLPLVLLAGTAERLFFTRVAQSTPSRPLAIMTDLALIVALAFALLRLARSQLALAVKPQLVQPQWRDVALMGALDALQMLLALDGAAHVPGSVQAMLAQAVLPLSLGFSLLTSRLLPPLLFSAPRRTLCAVLPSAAVALTIVILLIPTPWADSPENQQGSRLEFASSIAVGAASTAYKQRSLSRAPLAPIVLNSWLPLFQAGAGVLFGPPLLYVLRNDPIFETAKDVMDSILCFLNLLGNELTGDAVAPDRLEGEVTSSVCGSDGMPFELMAIFILASLSFHVASMMLLRSAGELWLHVCSALMLPLTILAFVRPLPTLRDWMAPPEPLDDFYVVAAVVLVVALVAHHADAIHARFLRGPVAPGSDLSSNGGQPSRESSSLDGSAIP